jgi:hypothetical protein
MQKKWVFCPAPPITAIASPKSTALSAASIWKSHRLQRYLAGFIPVHPSDREQPNTLSSLPGPPQWLLERRPEGAAAGLAERFACRPACPARLHTVSPSPVEGRWAFSRLPAQFWSLWLGMYRLCRQCPIAERPT